MATVPQSPDTHRSAGPKVILKPLRLLALDGGGIRGLSSLVILQEVMNQVRRDAGLDETPSPCEYFDLIGGTGTGGLIALLLGRFRMSIDDAIEVYSSLGRDAFTATSRFTWFRRTDRYDHQRLEWCLKKESRARLCDPEEPLEDPLGQRSCRTFVLASQRFSLAADPILLRTYSSKHADATPCKVWQAARATTAAPAFFEPISVPIRAGGVTTQLVDAGMGSNNPSEHVLNEARSIWGRDHPLGCLLSIGTGYPPTVNIRNKAFFSSRISIVAQASLEIVQDCERTHESMFKEESKLEDESGFYVRLNVDRGMQDVGVCEWDKLQEVTAHTLVYLSKMEVSKMKYLCARRLAICSKMTEVHVGPMSHVIPNSKLMSEHDNTKKLKSILQAHADRSNPTSPTKSTGTKSEANFLAEIAQHDETLWSRFRKMDLQSGLGDHGEIISLLRDQSPSIKSEWRKAVFRLLDVGFSEVRPDWSQNNAARSESKLFPVRSITTMQ